MRVDHARQIVHHRRDLGAVAQHIQRTGGAGAGQIMIHLAAHGENLALDHARPAARGRVLFMGIGFAGQHATAAS